MVKNAKSKPPEPITPAARARNVLKRMDRVPAMSDVPQLLREAREAEVEAQKRVDALLVLARERGLTLSGIGGLLGLTKQGALARHKSALKRMGL